MKKTEEYRFGDSWNSDDENDDDDDDDNDNDDDDNNDGVCRDNDFESIYE